MSSAAPAAVETAVPAAPPAAPPSAPSAAAPDTRSPDDILDSLKQNTIAWGHGKTQDAPAEPNSATPAQTAEGNTPPTEAPAPVAPSTAYDDWIKRYGSPEKAATESFALEGRIAEMAKELKELKSAQPAPAPAAPQAATPVAPAPTPQAQAPQAQPAQPTATPTIQGQALEHALTYDAQCRDLIKQHNANVATLKGLYDPETGAGEIPTLRQQIASNNAVIAHPDVDELVKDNARAALQRAEMTLAAREATHARLNLDNKSLDLDFRSRVGGFVSQLEGQSAERAREAEDERKASASAQEFVGHWPAAFDAAFKEAGFDPEMRDEIHNSVKTQALARPDRIDVKDLPTFMKEAVKAEFDKVDKHHRFQARAYALRKNADVASPTTSAAAVTAPPTSTTDDPEDAIERLRVGTRQAFNARRSAR